MRRSVSCSDLRRDGTSRPRRTTAATLAVAVVAALYAPVSAKVFLTREDALRVAFGDADVVREAAYLSEAQVSRAREIAGPDVEIVSALVTRYVARLDGTIVGTAYVDTHRVRTLEETLMVVVAPDGTVARVEVLTFREPEDYKPKAIWFDQFPGRTLDEELAVKRGIHGITGATLSAEAATAAVRRVLAIHRVLHEDAGP